MRIPDKITAEQYRNLCKTAPTDKKGRIRIDKSLPEYKEKFIEPIVKRTQDVTFIITQELPDLNTYINDERGSRYAAANLKENATNVCANACKNVDVDKNAMYDIEIHWIVPNNKKDADNIFFGVKFILDGMVKSNVLSGDGRKNIRNISHTIETIKENYQVQITLIPV